MSKISKKIIAVLCSFTFMSGQAQLLSLSNVFAEEETPVSQQEEVINKEVKATSNYTDNFTFTFSGKEATLTGVAKDKDGNKVDIGKEVTIPNKVTKNGVEYSVTKIADNALKNELNITKIVIQNSITSIPDNLFDYAQNLKEIVVLSGNKRLYSKDGVLYEKYSFSGDYLRLVKCPEAISGSITIPKNTSEIYSDAFTDYIENKNAYKNLTEIKVESGNINFYVKGSVLYFKDLPVDDGSNIAGAGTGKKAVKCLTNKSGVVNLEKDIMFIMPGAFANCDKVTEINIPKSISDGEFTMGIPDYTFRRCTSLKNINMQSGNSRYYSINGVLYDNISYINDYEYVKGVLEYPEGKKDEVFKVPSGIGIVSVSSLKDHKYLKKIIFPKSVQGIYINDRNYEIKRNVFLNTTADIINKNITLAAPTGSFAENYAKKNKLKFESTIESVKIKQSSNTTSSIKLSWNKVSGVTGYKVYKSTSKSGTYSCVATLKGASTTSYTNTKLSSGKIYYYKVRAYKTVNKSNYYSDYSPILTASTKCSTPSIKVTLTTKKTAKTSWSKISGASGYKIYRATSKNGSYKLVKTISSGSTTSYTNTGLTSKKTYYYKVRAYKVVNSSNVYSSYSSVKYIKVK